RHRRRPCSNRSGDQGRGGAPRGAAPHRAGVEARRHRRDDRAEPAVRGDHRRPCRLTVAKLIYATVASLDGYVADAQGNFDWAAPDEEVHRFVNDLERPIGAFLFGRRMYDVMVFWETAHDIPGQSDTVRDFGAIWQSADKVVYSRTLTAVSRARTRIG